MKIKLNYAIIPLITIAVSVAGSYLTDLGMDWYNTINLPEITPPGSLIGAVWTIIFILSTISALLVWNLSKRNKRIWWIIGIFIANAVLNVFWSGLFFGLHLIGASIIEMIILEISVLALIILAWPVSRWASILLFPYAGWVIFATYLAYNIWLLNK